MSKYDQITIKIAMNKIAKNEFVLPAIQRKFVWRPNQITMLFDSIMRDYPINSFMLWKITDQKIQQDYKFYLFLKDYADKYHEDNPDAPTQALTLPFSAVIDGQQRFTSLYVGLYGTYRYKKPSKWWKNNEESMPTRRLYLDLLNPISQNIDNEKMYDFRFLSEEELKTLSTVEHLWFKVGDVMKFNDSDDVDKFIEDNNLLKHDFAKKTIRRLYKKLNEDYVINYYTETAQDQDKILDVFLRTNSGGTALSFSDLLMSISSANWTKFDAREEMKKLRDEVYYYGNPRFDISQDLILKNMLVLSDVDVKFKIKNFGKNNIAIFEKNWDKIKRSIVATFGLLEKLGFNDFLLRAKNATIPVTYYIYKHDLADQIVKDNYDEDDKKRISKWLTMALLKGIFGGHSDSVLKDLREVIKQSSKSKYFPLKEIVDKFKSESDKNYTFNDEVINGYLTEQYQSIKGSLVLYLLYPDVVLKNGKAVAQDHMHPKNVFMDQNKFKSVGFIDEKFCEKKENWNSVLNLQLLSENANKSKSKTPLQNWVNNENKTKTELMIDDDVSLDVKDFKKFIENRKKNLVDTLKSILK